MITLAERVIAFINSEGHLTESVSSDNSTNVRFRSRGLNFTATTLYGDEGYLQLSCGMTLAPDVNFTAGLLRALWDCQERFKCVKFSLTADETVFVCSLESYFPELDGFQPTFWRAVSTIDSALNAGLNEIRTNNSVKAAADKFIEEFSQGDAG